MLTTSAQEKDVMQSYRDGACSYITKPMDLEGFFQVVRQFEIYWTAVSRIPSP